MTEQKMAMSNGYSPVPNGVARGRLDSGQSEKGGLGVAPAVFHKYWING